MSGTFTDLKLSALKRSIGPAMKIIDSLTAEISPKNSIAEFIDQNFKILFQPPPDVESADDMNALIKFLSKLMVLAANENPRHAFNQQTEYHNKFTGFYVCFVENDPSDPDPDVDE